MLSFNVQQTNMIVFASILLLVLIANYFYYPYCGITLMTNLIDRIKFHLCGVYFVFKKIKYKRMVNKTVKILNKLKKRYVIPNKILSDIYSDISEAWDMLNESFRNIDKLYKCRVPTDMKKIIKGIKYGTIRFCVSMEKLQKEIENVVKPDK